MTAVTDTICAVRLLQLRRLRDLWAATVDSVVALSVGEL